MWTARVWKSKTESDDSAKFESGGKIVKESESADDE